MRGGIINKDKIDSFMSLMFVLEAFNIITKAEYYRLGFVTDKDDMNPLVKANKLFVDPFRLMSDGTARRKLIYFLVEIRAITPFMAASYLVDVGAKTDLLDTLSEMMEIARENNYFYPRNVV